MNIIIKLLLTSSILFASNVFAVEITPIFGSRNGGEFIDTFTRKSHTIDSSESYGLILGWPAEQRTNIELYYSHQNSDLKSVPVNIPTTNAVVNIPITIDYLHIGGTTPISDADNFKSFLTGGLGFTYLSPDLQTLQSDLRASFSIGLGAKWLLTKTISLRLEGRGLATLFNSNSALFCNGGCSLSVNGSLFWQTEIFAGIGIKF